MFMLILAFVAAVAAAVLSLQVKGLSRKHLNIAEEYSVLAQINTQIAFERKLNKAQSKVLAKVLTINLLALQCTTRLKKSC